MATQSYVDIGAMQRIESGSPTASISYVDLGGVQRQESSAAGPTNWKTWNTVTVSSNLKTLNTNTLVNIKTYDTIV